MNIWVVFRRIIRKHFFYHMMIPLFFGAAAEVGILMRDQAGSTFREALAQLLEFRHFAPVLAVVAAYMVVMLIIITKETTTPFEVANITKLEQLLQSATGYFALCEIPMTQWFEPGAFKYFAILLAKKDAAAKAKTQFQYDRVMIFTRAAHKRAAEATILDRYHAEALATAHVRLGIPLAWIGPREIREIVEGLSGASLDALQSRPRWLRGVSWFRERWPVQLDFAVIARPSPPGNAVIIVPFKKAEATVLEGVATAPYEALVAEIKRKAYEANGLTIRLDHDYPRLLGVC